ncbi:MAG TPA: SpvB/TcaC N-terminal domain-containing protein, partial [Flavisolibacter sp.]
MLQNKEPGNPAQQGGPSGQTKTKSNALEAPSITLPKGGGAIRGIDEKFTVNASNGSSAFSIPLPFTSARAMTPSLSLGYNSGSGNGIFGLGWSLGNSSIRRKTDTGLPQYADASGSDTFLLSGSEDLVPELKKDSNGGLLKDSSGNYIINEKDSADGQYTIRFFRPRIEAGFARIERWTHKKNAETRWRLISRDNVTSLYGWSSNSRLADPANPHRVFEWLPEFSFDDKGNCIRYQYKPEDKSGFDPLLLHNRNRFRDDDITYANIYPEKIFYGNKKPYGQFNDPYPAEGDFMFQAVFDYGEYGMNAPFAKSRDWTFRTDAFSTYNAGFEVRTTRLCRRVLFLHFFPE